jgi:hypothetical protein
VDEREPRISQGRGQALLEASGWRRLAELDHEVGQLAPRAPGPSVFPQRACGERAKPERLRDRQAPVGNEVVLSQRRHRLCPRQRKHAEPW